ncbi:uncharacterized protein LOC108668229 [Hyalella azteca]|uniref:Uncharacterized protein LOC108668229 n=1 Tax=Hyalella azteca TaxID=294128 RepID=A0A8B7NBB1_HYAAZ|nr:uncharacterized protein LOC108668229 [Hyalella azteca]
MKDPREQAECIVNEDLLNKKIIEEIIVMCRPIALSSLARLLLGFSLMTCVAAEGHGRRPAFDGAPVGHPDGFNHLRVQPELRSLRIPVGHDPHSLQPAVGYDLRSLQPFIDPAMRLQSRQALSRSVRAENPEGQDEARMVNFRSGLWNLLGQVPIDDFSQEKDGLSKNFYEYVRGTTRKQLEETSLESPAEENLDSHNLKPSMRSEPSSERIFQSDFGNTRLKDLPAEALEALKELGYDPKPKNEFAINIKSRAKLIHAGPEISALPTERNRPVSPPQKTIQSYNLNKPSTHSYPEDIHFYADAAASEQGLSPQPAFPPARAPPSTWGEAKSPEILQVLAGGSPIQFGDDNQIKMVDGVKSVIEISSESHPTKYFLSASYVDPSSPSQVKPLPIDILFKGASASELNKPPVNDQPAQFDYYHPNEKHGSQSLPSESPTIILENTEPALDQTVYNQNELEIRNSDGDKEEGKIDLFLNDDLQESDYLSQLQSKLTRLAQHLDEGIPASFEERPALAGKKHVTVHVNAGSMAAPDKLSQQSEVPFVIPKHVSEMVENISSIIGENPSLETMNAMITHFSKVFQHAEKILFQNISDIADVEQQTEVAPEEPTTQAPAVSSMRSPQHVVIVYRPVLFVSHANDSDWSKVIGQGYKPTVLTEHGETSETLTREVLNTLGPDLLENLKEYFAGQKSQVTATGTRKFPDSLSQVMNDREELYHIQGDYIIIDGENKIKNEQSLGGNGTDLPPEVSVQDDNEKQALTVDLIVTQKNQMLPQSSGEQPEKFNKIVAHSKKSEKTSVNNGLKHRKESSPKNSSVIQQVHNIIVPSSSGIFQNESVLSAQSIEKLKELNPSAWWLGDLPDGNDAGKKYVVRRIIKRRRNKPTNWSKLPVLKPPVVGLSENPEASYRAHPQASVRGWRLPTEPPRRPHTTQNVKYSTQNSKSRTQNFKSVEEEGRMNDQSPLVILEKPITDLPVNTLADLVMKFYRSVDPAEYSSEY